MIIYVHVMFTFLPYYIICALHVVDVLSRQNCLSQEKDEIMMSFTNSCKYRVLIIVGWVCQRKVLSSIIMNSVSVGHSET
jgi:hypothetical protein